MLNLQLHLNPIHCKLSFHSYTEFQAEMLFNNPVLEKFLKQDFYKSMRRELEGCGSSVASFLPLSLFWIKSLWLAWGKQWVQYLPPPIHTSIKKAEHQRVDAFELWCWRRLLRVPWTARKSNQSIQRRSVLGVHWKDWCRSWNSNTLATWCKELTHWKRAWCWERLRAGGEGVNRGRNGWMTSLTQWTWVWINSRSWWWTGRPGVLQSMGSQRVGHNWETELNWAECIHLRYTCRFHGNFPHNQMRSRRQFTPVISYTPRSSYPPTWRHNIQKLALPLFQTLVTTVDWLHCLTCHFCQNSFLIFFFFCPTTQNI